VYRCLLKIMQFACTAGVESLRQSAGEHRQPVKNVSATLAIGVSFIIRLSQIYAQV
jgi:hypothetical protein